MQDGELPAQQQQQHINQEEIIQTMLQQLCMRFGLQRHLLIHMILQVTIQKESYIFQRHTPQG